MTKQITDKMVEKFAEECIGRGDSSSYEIFEHMYPGCNFHDMTMDQLNIYDDIVFTCDDCGWLVEAHERHEHNGDAICDQCYEYLDD